ncbi:MAG TPA: hypothetical protein VGC31_00010 [Paenirhodobacter sp.]
MKRHLIDRTLAKATHPKVDGARLKRFLEFARKEGIYPAIQTLSQRPVVGRTARKVQEFLRIEQQERSSST